MATVINGDSSYQMPLKTDYSSIMNTAFRSFKSYWIILAAITLINLATYYLISFPNFSPLNYQNSNWLISNISGWGILLSILFFLLGIGITIVFEYGLVLVNVKATSNEKPSIVDLFRPFKRFITVFFSAILLVIILFFGFLFLIIPGIYLLIRLGFVPYLVMDRNAGVIEAIEDSWKITKGHFWDIFLMGFINFILTVVIGFISIFITNLFNEDMYHSSLLTQIISSVICLPLMMYMNLTIGAMYNAIRGNRGNIGPINPVNPASI
jgi:hypothetical protein